MCKPTDAYIMRLAARKHVLHHCLSRRSGWEHRAVEGLEAVRRAMQEVAAERVAELGLSVKGDCNVFGRSAVSALNSVIQLYGLGDSPQLTLHQRLQAAANAEQLGPSRDRCTWVERPERRLMKALRNLQLSVDSREESWKPSAIALAIETYLLGILGDPLSCSPASIDKRRHRAAEALKQVANSHQGLRRTCSALATLHDLQWSGFGGSRRSFGLPSPPFLLSPALPRTSSESSLVQLSACSSCSSFEMVETPD